MRLLSFLGCAFGAFGFIFCLAAAPAQADGAFATVFLFCGNSGQSETLQGGLNSGIVFATTSNSGSQPSFGCASNGSSTANLGTGSLQGSVTNSGINPLSSQAEASFEITGDVLLPAGLSFASIALREAGASFTGNGSYNLQVIITNDATLAFASFTCVGGVPSPGCSVSFSGGGSADCQGFDACNAVNTVRGDPITIDATLIVSQSSLVGDGTTTFSDPLELVLPSGATFVPDNSTLTFPTVTGATPEPSSLLLLGTGLLGLGPLLRRRFA